MELSSFVGRTFALKNELLSVLPKDTDVKTYLSNIDQIFMILTLIKLGTEFDNIREEQILTSSTIPTFDDIFAWLLRHSSTATWSRPSEVSNEPSIMPTPSHPRGDSRSIVVATEAEANDLIVPTIIDRVTFETCVISYMVVRLTLLMSPSLLNRQLRTSLRLHLRE